MKPKKPASPAKIVPPDGWKDGEGFGFLASLDANGEKVPLVRLHDLAAWLCKSLPLKTAVDTICTALSMAGISAVYELDAIDFAQPYGRDMGVWSEFAPERTTEELAANLRAQWLMPDFKLSQLVNVNGFPVEFDKTRESAFDYVGRSSSLGSLAVTHELAHALWGWGSVAEVVRLHAVPKVDAQSKALPSGAAPGANVGKDGIRVRIPGTPWTDEQETQLQQDFKDARGKSAAEKCRSVAALWSIKTGSVKKQLSAIKEKVKKAGAVGQMAGHLSGNR